MPAFQTSNRPPPPGVKPRFEPRGPRLVVTQAQAVNVGGADAQDAERPRRLRGRTLGAAVTQRVDFHPVGRVIDGAGLQAVAQNGVFHRHLAGQVDVLVIQAPLRVAPVHVRRANEKLGQDDRGQRRGQDDGHGPPRARRAIYAHRVTPFRGCVVGSVGSITRRPRSGERMGLCSTFAAAGARATPPPAPPRRAVGGKACLAPAPPPARRGEVGRGVPTSRPARRAWRTPPPSGCNTRRRGWPGSWRGSGTSP